MSRGWLSEAEVERYREDGFVFPVSVMSQAQSIACREHYEAVEAGARDRRELAACLKSNSHFVMPMVDEVVRHPVILDAVESVLGPDLLVWSTTFWIKEACSEGHVTWHQDLHYWGLSEDDEVTAWLAITPATVGNGCMRFVPGSHHRRVAHGDTFAPANMLSRGQAVAVEVDEADAVNVELNPGQMSLHHGRLFHASGPNRSDDRRIGLAVRYIKPSMRQVVGRRDYAWLVRGTDDYRHFEAPPAPASDLDPAAVERYRAMHNAQLDVFYRGVDEDKRPARL